MKQEIITSRFLGTETVNAIVSNVFKMASQHIKVEPVPETLVERNKFRVEEVKVRFGRNLIGHPDYKFNPRHSNNPEVYIPARFEYIQKISAWARADRWNNPAWIRAQAINNALNMEH